MLSGADIPHRNVVLIDATEVHYKFKIVLGNLVLENDKGEVITRLNKQKVLAVFVIGRISLTSVMLDYCQKNAIAVVLLNGNFRLTGFWSNFAEANFLLRQKQYQHDQNLLIAKILIHNKINNQVVALQKIRQKTEALDHAINACKDLALRCENINALDELMGLEGNAAKIYFKQMFADHNWQGRKPRIKLDPINVMLDIGYTFLFNYTESFIRLFGFDVYKGNLHQTWFRRKSLVCDAVEPFRVLIDYQTRKSLNLSEFQSQHFEYRKQQYYLKPQHIKTYSKAYFEILVAHKQEFFEYTRDYYRAFMRDKPMNEYPQFIPFNKE